MESGYNNDHLLFIQSTLNDPTNLFISDLDGSNEHQLTTINQELSDELIQPETRQLLFKGSDGEAVEGWLMLPTRGEAPFPTILYIHGGPHSGWGHIYSYDFQMLAGAGFAVLFINHRASTGYGDKFSTAIKGDWGNLDCNDLIAGLDHAIGMELVDADRLGCCGLSGGGNLSCWLVGHSDRFKAAVPENPLSNFHSFYGTSDIGVWFCTEELGGHPHEIPEIYARCSPTSYAHNCKTPTLMVQGEADFRCPAEQSEQFYSILKANHCVVEMLRLPNSPHGGSIAGSFDTRKAQNEALLKWMQRYILGECV
ncbi:MAG: S9 family peptidase [Anaerolineaceae bacterium]|nr:S9 family peptidase [Anaerolineaceae bacterium]